MATYNIPGVTTSVIDYSNITNVNLGGRSVLIIGFSKFGDDQDYMEFSNGETAKTLLGGVNTAKYGKSVYYLLGALSVTSKVYFRRLVPSDSTYANIVIDENVNSIVVSNVTDKQSLLNSTNILNNIAKNRGEGYNEFYITYEPALDVEKIYADDEGDADYKYNFLRVSIYQNTPNGVVNILPATVISLIDTDPFTNTPILDLTTGETLYVNDKISSKNNFVDIFLNETYLPDLKKYPNIKSLVKDKNVPEMVLKDITTGVNYKVKADQKPDGTYSLYIEATKQEGLPKITLKYYNAGANNYKKFYVDNGELKLDDDPEATADTSYDALYTVAPNNFVKLYIDPASQQLVIEEFKTLRSDLYKKLINSSWQLQAGSDGQNLHINDIFNFNGPGDTNAENAKMLLIDFINNDADLRETMYPKYKFDYIVDWSADLDVLNAIINLTDSSGLFFGILALPIAYDPSQDYQIRTEKLYQSSFNNALYSGQWNLKHYDEYSGKNISMALSYYMMINHLKIDNTMSITEPVAGIVKGQLPVSNIQLSYSPSSADIEKLRFQQINTVISENDGIYMIDQLTMYKKASKLSRINVVKVIQKMRKDLPPLLKPYIQVKETANNSSVIEGIVSNYMNQWKVITGVANPDAIFSDIKISTMYIEEDYTLVVTIKVTPIGTIEKISIPIIVQ
jgi:hypothetical protein